MAAQYVIDDEHKDHFVLPENESGISVEIIPRRTSDSPAPWYHRSNLINWRFDVGNYYRIKILKDIKSELSEAYRGGELVDQFQLGPFGHLLDWEPGQNSKPLLHSVLSRAVVTEVRIWFHIRGQYVEYTIQDYALITGLRFGPTDFDPRIQREPKASCFFQDVCGGHGQKALLHSHLGTLTSENDPDGQLQLKLANLLMANCFILGHDGQAPPHQWLWELIDDTDEFNSFPWVAYSYKTLQYYLRTFQARSRKYHIYGLAWALMIWAYEVMPGFGEQFAERVSTTDVPRCLRWKFCNTFTGMSDAELYALLDDPEWGITRIEPEDQEIEESYYQSVHQLGALLVKFHMPKTSYIVDERPRVHRVDLGSQHAVGDS